MTGQRDCFDKATALDRSTETNHNTIKLYDMYNLVIEELHPYGLVGV